jgi:hypothetical protein
MLDRQMKLLPCCCCGLCCPSCLQRTELLRKLTALAQLSIRQDASTRLRFVAVKLPSSDGRKVTRILLTSRQVRQVYMHAMYDTSYRSREKLYRK